MSARSTVAILLFDDVEVLDFAGPFQIFSAADELHGGQLWRTDTVAESAGTIRTTGGLKIVSEFTLENCPAPRVLVIPGGGGPRALLQKTGMLEWIRWKGRTAECMFSVCKGALVLGRAGLLDHLTSRHITLPWICCEKSYRRRPTSCGAAGGPACCRGDSPLHAVRSLYTTILRVVCPRTALSKSLPAHCADGSLSSPAPSN